MCGRTSLFVPQSVLEERFDAKAATPLTPRYNIAPRDKLACIPNHDPGTIDLFEWGFLPHWADDPDDVPRPINARGETVGEKPIFKDAFQNRRCLVLADGFYEWKGTRGNKEPYRVTLTDEQPFAMAGLWEEWEANGESRSTVTIITTSANDVIEPIHDRMPVILEPDEEEYWLGADSMDSLQSLLDPYPNTGLATYPVSKAVNNPANDSPEVIEERSDKQSGLGEFS